MQTITISTPSEDLIVSQNGNQPQQPSSGLEKLLQANTSLAVWLIFLAIGGGLLARYYVRIGYLPEMEWNAALVYLFVCSVWGSVIGLVLTISLYLPGVIWSELIVFETPLDDRLTYRADHDDASGKRSRRKEPCLRSILVWLGLPFFLALFVSHLSLRFSKPDVKLIDSYWISAVIILATIIVVMWLVFRHLSRDKGPDKRTISRQVFKYPLWFALSVLLNQIAMYVIYRLADRTPDTRDFLTLTVLCPLFVSVSTHVVATRHRYNSRQALVAALVTAFVLLIVADRFSDLSMKLMSRYGVGEDRYNLLVKPEIIPLLNSEGVSTYGTQQVCNVQILSKMGEHYFVSVDGKIGMNAVRVRIMLPKSDVIAIRRLESVESPKN